MAGLLGSMVAGAAGGYAKARGEELQKQDERQGNFDLQNALLDARHEKDILLKKAGFQMEDEREDAKASRIAADVQAADAEYGASATQPGQSPERTQYERYQDLADRAASRGRFPDAESFGKLADRYKPKDVKFSTVKGDGGEIYSFNEATGGVEKIAQSDAIEYKNAGRTLFVLKRDKDGNPYPVGIYQDEAEPDRAESELEYFKRDPDGFGRYQSAKSDGGITASQRANNLEIDKAREFINGLSADEVKRRTAKHTETGRANDDFDPLLSKRVTLANQRKVGEDAWFDKLESGLKTDGGLDTGDPAEALKRFTNDPAMTGYRLGNLTAKGHEVYDNAGKLVGYYR